MHKHPLTSLSSFASADPLAGGSSNFHTRVSDVMQVSNAAQASNSLEAAAIEVTISNYFISLNHGDNGAVLQLYAGDLTEHGVLRDTVFPRPRSCHPFKSLNEQSRSTLIYNPHAPRRTAPVRK